MSDDNNMQYVFVAVHSGAGIHAKDNESRYKDICKKACKQAMILLKAKASALEAATAAVAELENDELTNCGKGSNLTINGTVECDASVMDGESLHFGAVGALSGVSNPVAVARCLVEEQKQGPLPFGRVRPSILVGKGAQQFCVSKGIEINTNLLTAASLKSYRHYSRKCLTSELYTTSAKKQKCEKNTPLQLEDSQGEALCETRNDSVQDTVGAVCLDHYGNVAGAASSGGIWLKHSGRLGASAVYGAGCWAQNQTTDLKPGVAAVTSGCGEQLMQTLLAKTCCDSVRSCEDLTQSLASVFKEQFLESEFLKKCSERFAGVLLLKSSQSEEKEVEVAWIHSTASMCIGFMSGAQNSPSVLMSRLDSSSVPGQSFTMSSHLL